MTTHFHVVLAVDDDVISRGMHDWFEPHAQEFDRRHGRYGHLRAEPFKLRPAGGDAALRRVTRSITIEPTPYGKGTIPFTYVV